MFIFQSEEDRIFLLCGPLTRRILSRPSTWCDQVTVKIQNQYHVAKPKVIKKLGSIKRI